MASEKVAVTGAPRPAPLPPGVVAVTLGAAASWVSVAVPETLGLTELSVAVIVGSPGVAVEVIGAS